MTVYWNSTIFKFHIKDWMNKGSTDLLTLQFMLMQALLPLTYRPSIYPRSHLERGKNIEVHLGCL